MLDCPVSPRPGVRFILLASFGLTASVLVAACAPDKGMNEAKDARAPGAAAPAAPPPPATAEPQSVDAAEVEEELPEAEGARVGGAAKPSKTAAPAPDREKKKEEKRDALDETRAKDGEADFDAEGDDLSRLQSQLVSLEGELRRAGVPIPPEGALAGNLGGEDVTTLGRDGSIECEKACELTEAICDLSESICGLRERHPQDERYINACDRAKGDCQLGKRSCDACSGG